MKGDNQFSTIIALLNNGYLDTLKPKAVVIECVERYCLILGGSQDMDFSFSRPIDEVRRFYAHARYISNPPASGTGESAREIVDVQRKAVELAREFSD